MRPQASGSLYFIYMVKQRVTHTSTQPSLEIHMKCIYSHYLTCLPQVSENSWSPILYYYFWLSSLIQSKIFLLPQSCLSAFYCALNCINISLIFFLTRNLFLFRAGIGDLPFNIAQTRQMLNKKLPHSPTGRSRGNSCNLKDPLSSSLSN